jgi:hypothetical protein
MTIGGEKAYGLIMTTFFATPSLQSINQRNAEFWDLITQVMNDRLCDETLRDRAMHDMEAEAVRGTPVYYRKTFEQALEDAAAARTTFLTGVARRGGIARKSDPLQMRIEQLVQIDPEQFSWTHRS